MGVFRNRKIKAKHLVYAATARCQCGAGLAYLPGSGARAWDCSAILLDEAIPKDQEGSVRHDDIYPFAFYEIKSEIQPSARGATTRPQSPNQSTGR